VDLGGIKLGADITIRVRDISHLPAKGMDGPSTVIYLEWEAANRPNLFPFMKAELAIYPLTATETQLDFSGVYEPPLGVLGSAMNAVAGHRIAESSVHRFVSEVAEHLRACPRPAALHAECRHPRRAGGRAETPRSAPRSRPPRGARARVSGSAEARGGTAVTLNLCCLHEGPERS
jgi:hypothetical protein